VPPPSPFGDAARTNSPCTGFDFGHFRVVFNGYAELGRRPQLRDNARSPVKISNLELLHSIGMETLGKVGYY
jgi:hypothetical protein